MRTPCSQQRTHEIQDTFLENMFPSLFFNSREKILCVGFLYDFLVRDKKGFENTLFEIRMVVKTPPSRTNIYIYNIYIYRKGKKETP